MPPGIQPRADWEFVIIFVVIFFYTEISRLSFML